MCSSIRLSPLAPQRPGGSPGCQKQCAPRRGDLALYAGHSLRSGLATSAAAAGVGEDNTHIATVDADGVALAAVNDSVSPDTLPSPESYAISSLMEEAITSSQLEGAATTRPVAQEMLRSGRQPRNHSEQMIYNNWATIQKLRTQTQQVLTSQLVYDIHAMITEGTLNDPTDAGRIRTRDDVVVQYRDQVVHQPPNAALLPARIEAFCAFANNDTDQWIHPVVKATILHFWIGYDHPFVDGNGRTARALFYWYLLSRKYWLFEYLSISRYFLKAPAQYMRAYLYTETDSRDLTYFIVYNLRIVRRAIDDLHTHVQRKQQEITDADELLRHHRDLNDRQRSLLAHALRHPTASYTIQFHKAIHNVVYETARTDLFDLTERGLLNREKRGKTYVFSPSDTIMTSLRQKKAPRSSPN